MGTWKVPERGGPQRPLDGARAAARQRRRALGLFIKVGSGTDFPNIHRLCEAIGVTLFADPSYGLNIETESVWAAAAIDFYMNGDDRVDDLSMVEKDDVLYVEARGRPILPPATTADG